MNDYYKELHYKQQIARNSGSRVYIVLCDKYFNIISCEKIPPTIYLQNIDIIGKIIDKVNIHRMDLSNHYPKRPDEEFIRVYVLADYFQDAVSKAEKLIYEYLANLIMNYHPRLLVPGVEPENIDITKIEKPSMEQVRKIMASETLQGISRL